MRAMQLRETGSPVSNPLEVTKLEPPTPGAGEIVVEVHACGVCRTDLHTVEGDLALPRLPLVPGHQIVGVVVARGFGATMHRLGDRVGVGWLAWTCGRCSFCESGHENLCPNARFTGLDVDGGYAQQALVDERFAYPLPEGLDGVNAAPLLCAGIIGYRSLRLSRIEPGGRLGLYGFGGSAHLAIQVARHWGCEVLVFSRGTEHQRHALELGAAWAGTAEDTPPEQLDAAVIFAPAGWLVPVALSHLRPGGTAAINAIHMSAIPQLGYDRLYGERVLRSVTNYTKNDATEFLALAAAIGIHTDVEQFPLEAANDALLRLKESRIRGAAVLRVSDIDDR